MVYSKSDDKGLIFKAEYRVVDRFGRDTPNGDYVYIEDFYIRPEFRRVRFLRQIIHDLAQMVGDAIYVYWERKKYNYRMSPLYKIININKGV